MKKLSFGFILMLLAASFVACNKSEDTPIAPEESVDNSTYTIMMYGCGGGNLDSSMILNIQEALLAGATERVNFTGQIKFSKRFQNTEVLAGTQRFIVGEAGDCWYDPVEVLPADLRLYDSKNLADFITWSKEQCPADEYILILWNHGGAWLPYDECRSGSRSVIYDDVNDGIGLSLNSLVKGINDSNTKFKMVYYDACLMGMIEILAGLTDCAEYTMSASHITPGMGGDYNSLIYHLNNSINFEQAMKEYCSETVAHWDPQGMPLDLMLVNNNHIESLLKEIKVLSGYLKEVAQICADYDEVEDADDLNKKALCEIFNFAVNACYHYEWSYDEDGYAYYPFYDLHHFVEILANGNISTYSARFVDIASRIKRAFADAIVCKQITTSIMGLDLSMGVTIVDEYIWDVYDYQPAYDQLVFQQKTGWGDWLKINPITPINNPDPSSFVDIANQDEGDTPLPLDEEIAYLLSLIGKK